MTASDQSALPPLGSQVMTACGGMTDLEVDTPGALYRGRWVFFCLNSCLQEFEEDPQSSCLVDHPLTE